MSLQTRHETTIAVPSDESWRGLPLRLPGFWWRVCVTLLILCAALCLAARATGAALFDNRTLAFSTPLNASGAAWRIVLYDVRSAQSINLWTYQGRVPAQLVWSPDGRYIAASLFDSGDIVLLDVDHRSGRALVDADGVRSFPVWSPDSRLILFHENDDPYSTPPNVQIFRVDSDGQNLQRLTEEPSTNPTWSPDGSMVLYSASEGGDLYLMGPDGNERRMLLDNETRNTHPVMSPDGSQFAFLGYSFSGEVGDWIYVANADGSNVFRLASGTKMEGRPVWSPDGRQIAFVGQLRGDTYSSIFIADLRGGIRRLADHVEYAYDTLWSLWSPDGRYIAFEPSNADGLSIVEVATGQVTRLNRVRSLYPSWRP